MDEREATLWHEVVQHRDSIAPRLVLADFLMERGDPRGELIALQCAGHESERARELVQQHWDEWLGPLASALSPLRTEFRNGMLEVASIGRTNMEIDFRDLRHHELQLVHTVLPSYVWPVDYVAFLMCPDLDVRHVQIVGNMVEAFARARPRWSYRVLTYSDTTFAGNVGGSDIVPAFALLSSLMPDLEEIRFGWSRFSSETLRGVICELPRQFPGLQRIVVGELVLDEADRLHIQRLPQVIV